MSLTQQALYGSNTSPTMGATMLNPGQASSDTDWLAVFTHGLRGAAGGAINAAMQEQAMEREMVAAEYGREQNGKTLLVVLALVWLASQ